MPLTVMVTMSPTVYSPVTVPVMAVVAAVASALLMMLSAVTTLTLIPVVLSLGATVSTK